MHYARFSLAFVICNTLLLNLASPLLALTFLGQPRESAKSIAKVLAPKKIELDRTPPSNYTQRADILKSMCEVEFRARPEETSLENCEKYIDLVASKAKVFQDSHDLCIVGTYMGYRNQALDQFQTHGSILAKLSKESLVKILEFCEANIADIMHVHISSGDTDSYYPTPHLNRVHTIAYLLKDYPRGKQFFLRVYEKLQDVEKNTTIEQVQDEYERERLQDYKRYIILSWIFPALVAMGNFDYLSGNYESAMKFYSQANKVYSDAKDEFKDLWTFNSNLIYLPYRGHYGPLLNPLVPASFTTLHVNYGRELAKQGKYVEAEQLLLSAIDDLEKTIMLLQEPSEKLVLAELASPLYATLQDVYSAQKKYDKALELTDRLRSFAYGSNLDLDRYNSDEEHKKFGISASDMQKLAKNLKSTFVIFSIPELPRYDYSNASTLEDRLQIWVIQPDGQIHFRSVNVEEAIRYQFLNAITSNLAGFTGLIAYLLVTVALMCGGFFIITKFIKPIKPLIVVIFGAISGVILSVVPMKFAIDHYTGSSATTQSPSNASTNSSNQNALPDLIQTTLGFTKGSITNDTAQPQLICGSSEKCLEDMYSTLIKPIERLLPRNPEDLVVLVPYRSLHSLPFSILKSKNGKYFVENHTFTVVPSVGVLKQIYERSESVISNNPKDEHLIVGNPIMPSVKYGEWDEPAKLSPLPSAEIEAKEIAKLLNVRPLIGASANLDKVTKNFFGSRFIHLATHGIVYEDLDQGSALALTPVKDGSRHPDNEGLLRSSDLITMRSNAEMAVLSACETGLGAESLEGNLAITRSFLVTGIPTVVSSLWQVPDASTSDLMLEFYKNLLSNPNKAKSLRQAMLAVKERYQDPRYWGGFMVTGLAELPPPSPTAKEVVGYGYCASLRNLEQNTLSNRTNYIYAAELHSTPSGFILKMTSSPDALPKFDKTLTYNNKLETFALPFGGSELTVDERGNFSNSFMQLTSRGGCSWAGRLKFVGDAKAKLQRLKKLR